MNKEMVEVEYEPMYGLANPINKRTMLKPDNLYLINKNTSNQQFVPKGFPEGNQELVANANFGAVPKLLRTLETYTNSFLGATVPCHMANLPQSGPLQQLLHQARGPDRLLH